MSNPFSEALAEVDAAVREGRRLFGGRIVCLDVYALSTQLTVLHLQAACAARAIRYYEGRRSDEGDLPLGPLPDPDALLDAILAVDKFVMKRRADVASMLGDGTAVSAPRLAAALARVDELAVPYAKQLRDYRDLFPDVDGAGMFYEPSPERD